MQTILVIDDDVYIGDMLEEMLTKEGYGVRRAYSGSEALLVLASFRPDLVLLDLMLPGVNGEAVLDAISGIPVIVVSARTGVEDKVNLLLEGASDYVTKPFHGKELLARITVQLRKASLSEGQYGAEDVLRFRDLVMNIQNRQVFIKEQSVKLTRTEYAILKLLLQNPDQVIPKSVMLDRISEESPDCVESSLKVHISHLRKKLKEADGEGTDYIESVWGIGFKMNKISGQADFSH